MIFNIFGSKKKVKKPTASSASSLWRSGLQKTRERFSSVYASLTGQKKLAPETREALQKLLIQSDVGPETTQFILDETEAQLRKNSVLSADQALKKVLQDILAPSQTFWEPVSHRPTVLLFVGVNGSGKTTTIGRLASRLSGQGHKVTMGAGDTFRAAAIEQLQMWGQRTNCPVISQQAGADSASVLFEAVQNAQNNATDFLLADTAGRLHNHTNLMNELAKVRKVIQKKQPEAPHETWLVIDATVGQNGLKQAQIFKESVDVTGIILTKMDGTAKGGIVFAISQQLGLPVRFVGVGEREQDLLPFSPSSFVDALLPQENDA